VQNVGRVLKPLFIRSQGSDPTVFREGKKGETTSKGESKKENTRIGGGAARRPRFRRHKGGKVKEQKKRDLGEPGATLWERGIEGRGSNCLRRAGVLSWGIPFTLNGAAALSSGLEG